MGGLTNDIQLNRGDELLIMDREKADQQEKILEQAQTIRNLQNHSKYFGGDFHLQPSPDPCSIL